MSEGAKIAPLRTRRPCPECGKPSQREAYPFCSQRCKEIDLNRWFSGTYVIPATEDDSEPGEESQAERPPTYDTNGL